MEFPVRTDAREIPVDSIDELAATAPNQPAMGFFAPSGPSVDGQGHTGMAITLVTLVVTDHGQVMRQGFNVHPGDGMCVLEPLKQNFRCIAKTVEGPVFQAEFFGNGTQPIVVGGSAPSIH